MPLTSFSAVSLDEGTGHKLNPTCLVPTSTWGPIEIVPLGASRLHLQRIEVHMSISCLLDMCIPLNTLAHLHVRCLWPEYESPPPFRRLLSSYKTEREEANVNDVDPGAQDDVHLSAT